MKKARPSWLAAELRLQPRSLAQTDCFLRGTQAPGAASTSGMPFYAPYQASGIRDLFSLSGCFEFGKLWLWAAGSGAWASQGWGLWGLTVFKESHAGTCVEGETSAHRNSPTLNPVQSRGPLFSASPCPETAASFCCGLEILFLLSC
jgi:hypothetical protein